MKGKMTGLFPEHRLLLLSLYLTAGAEVLNINWNPGQILLCGRRENIWLESCEAAHSIIFH